MISRTRNTTLPSMFKAKLIQYRFFTPMEARSIPEIVGSDVVRTPTKRHTYIDYDVNRLANVCLLKSAMGYPIKYPDNMARLTEFDIH